MISISNYDVVFDDDILPDSVECINSLQICRRYQLFNLICNIIVGNLNVRDWNASVGLSLHSVLMKAVAIINAVRNLIVVDDHVAGAIVDAVIRKMIDDVLLDQNI